jgi:TonB family protein
MPTGAIRTAVLLAAFSIACPWFAWGQTEGNWIIQRTGPRFTPDGDVIRVSGDGGWIRTRPALLDFVLRLEFRAVTQGARGAALIRTSPLRPGDWPGVGIRIGLDTTGTRPLGSVSVYEGQIEPVGPDTPAGLKPVGEWRVLEVRADGDDITVTIDGTQTQHVKVTDVWAGYVGLEADGGTMEYRSVSVTRPTRPLDCRADGLVTASQPFKSNTPGVVLPKVAREVKPRYTVDAMSRRAQGRVLLEAVVQEDGKIGDVCVKRGVDPDLDLQAVAAAKAWRFVPGTRDGLPVGVLVSMELSFTLGQ